jgi:biotin synthase-related radical SAM superfamily protein
MPLYMIERDFGEQLDLTDDAVELIDEIGAEEGVHWVFSFLTADRRRTYCLYEAPSPDAIFAAARRANVPADSVVEVSPAVAQFSGRLRDWAEAVPSSADTPSV